MLLALALLSRPALAMPWDVAPNQIKSFNKAVRDINAGNPDEAIERIDKLLAKGGECGRCLTLKAQALLNLNRPKEGFDLLVPLLPDFPDKSTLMGIASNAAFASGRFEDARNLALAALTAAPAEYWPRSILVQTDLRLGAYGDARAAIEAAREHLDDRDGVACLEAYLATEEKKWDVFNQLMSTCRRSKQDKEIDVLWTNYLMLTGDTAAAAASVEGTSLEDAMSDSLRLGVLIEAKQWDEALRLANDTLGKNPGDASTLVNRSGVRWELGDHDGAIDDLQEAIPHLLEIDVKRHGDMVGVMTKGAEQDTLHLVVDNLLSFLSDSSVQLDPARVEQVTKLTLDLALSEQDRLAIEATRLVLSDRLDEAWTKLEPFAGSSDPRITQFIGWLANLNPRDVPAWAADRVDPDVVRSATWNDAFAAYNAKDYGRCLELLDGLDAPPADRTDAELLTRTYACAVNAEAFDRADAILAQTDDALLGGYTLYNHGVHIYNAGQYDRGLDLMRRGCNRLEEQQRKPCLDDLPAQ